MKWAFANKQPWADKWAKHTPNIKKLPERKKSMAKKKKGALRIALGLGTPAGFGALPALVQSPNRLAQNAATLGQEPPLLPIRKKKKVKKGKRKLTPIEQQMVSGW
jgi:hypothetical protein